MTRYLVPRMMLISAVAAFGLAWLPAAGVDAAQPAKVGKTIEVAICLDVSGSMNGLINSAKAKLWDIVNDLAKAKPTPNLRVALLSYGGSGYDQQAGWVRLDQEFTTDLDGVYQKLNALKVNGSVEYVARVSRDAVEQLKWSDDKAALKIIFVCGNESAEQDKMFKLGDIAQMALKKDIIINTIYCGNANNAEAKAWKEFADLAEGRYACIDQDRGTVAITTPVDKELAELSVKLNDTYVAYGKLGKDKASNQKAQDANAGKAGAPAEATRALAKGGALYRNSDWDLVDKLKEDPNFDIKKIPEDELCDELKKLKPEEREKYVKDMLAKREALQKQINDLGVKRQNYITDETKKNPSKADKAFDEAVRGAIRTQAEKKGLKLPDE